MPVPCMWFGLVHEHKIQVLSSKVYNSKNHFEVAVVKTRAMYHGVSFLSQIHNYV